MVARGGRLAVKELPFVSKQPESTERRPIKKVYNWYWLVELTSSPFPLLRSGGEGLFFCDVYPGWRSVCGSCVAYPGLLWLHPLRGAFFWGRAGAVSYELSVSGNQRAVSGGRQPERELKLEALEGSGRAGA